MKIVLVTPRYYTNLLEREKRQVEIILNAYKRVNPKGVIDISSDINVETSLIRELTNNTDADVIFLDESSLIEHEVIKILESGLILNRENYIVFMLDEQHVLKWNDNKTSISILDFYDVDHKLYKYFSK
nr:MAG TPA: hypothetical protein [Herelleviridae sp.]